VLEYFDAYLIGLTATPSKQTFGFFNQNLVMEYNHEKAVADGVNVNYDVYRIQTEITAQGSKIDAGFYVDKRDRQTRKKRWEQLDEDFEYDPNQLDRDVVAPDQIRTVLQTFRDQLFTEIFPGRTNVPKTLIFAKDDSHADDIVRICREVFDKGNDFCKKITYKTTGESPKDLIQKFRNSYNPRIAVTVDMIATGTDVKPLEVVFFMRSVKSRSFFEQMKGRGVRVISETEMAQVTTDITRKTRFVDRRRRRCLRAGHDRLAPVGEKAQCDVRQVARRRRARQSRARSARKPRRTAGALGETFRRSSGFRSP
jgi:type I restriction enzyme R subunit